MSKNTNFGEEKECKCCYEWWYPSEIKQGLCPNCYDYFKQLKQQLAEKDTRIEELEGQFAYECECNKQLVDLQKQLEEKQKTIDEINKEFVQAVHDWKTLCAEKDEEIEELKTKQELTFMHSKEDYFQRCNLLEEENIKLQFAQTQLAIQELEKVKTLIQNAINFEKPNFVEVYDAINKQINDLRGEKDAED